MASRNSIIRFSLPLRVQTSKKKSFILNMNVMRTAYFRTLSTAKKRYSEIVIKQAPDIKYKIERCDIKIKLFPKTRRRADLSNACSVCDKFMCDALTDKGYWDDDTYLVIPKVMYEFGEVDKDNPRFDIEITVKKKALN